MPSRKADRKTHAQRVLDNQRRLAAMHQNQKATVVAEPTLDFRHLPPTEQLQMLAMELASDPWAAMRMLMFAAAHCAESRDEFFICALDVWQDVGGRE